MANDDITKDILEKEINEDNTNRVNNINSVANSVLKMKNDIDKKVLEVRKVSDTGSVRNIQKSLNKTIQGLNKVVGALATGVKTVTVETAKASKDVVSKYGKAVSEDISFNKQNIVAMALSRSTPIFGYFAAKFMETGVFKSAADRIKSQIGRAFTSLGTKAKEFLSRKKEEKENKITKIPKMQKGGYVEKGGVAKLHAAEVVIPIEKLLERIDQSKEEMGIIKDSLIKSIRMRHRSELIREGEESKRGFIQSVKRAMENAFQEEEKPIQEQIILELRRLRKGFGFHMNRFKIFVETIMWENPLIRESNSW